MRSIDGFNSGSAGSFGQGNASAAGLNKLGTGVDIAKTGMSSEVTFQASTGGTSYSTPIQAYNYGWKFNQFDVFVEKWNDPANPTADPEYRVRCVQGLTTFRNFKVDENGFLTDREFVWNRRIQKWNVFPTDSLVVDEKGTDEYFISDGDYVKIEKNKNYKVFLYKISPTIEAYDASVCPQIAIIEEGSPADDNVKSSFSGGGVMQSYIVSAETTSNNVVTADPLSGKIANFDAYPLNGAVKFNTDLIEVVLKEGSIGADGLTWLSGNIPVFAKPSYNPYEDYDIDGNIIAGVPFGTNWASYGDGNPVGLATNIPEPGGTANVFYWLGEDDVHNSIWNYVVAAQDMSAPAFNITSATMGSLVSSVVDPHFIKLKVPDKVPGEYQGIVEFEHTDLDIIATSQTSITAATLAVPTGKPVGNVGFKYFDCARRELAYIKWNPLKPEEPTGKGRFDVYQINNGPIVFQDEPLLLDSKKVATQGDAKWDTDNDQYVSPDITEIYYWGDSDVSYSKAKYRDNSDNIGGYLPSQPTRSSG
jgi:hypothetical protein